MDTRKNPQSKREKENVQLLEELHRIAIASGQAQRPFPTTVLEIISRNQSSTSDNVTICRWLTPLLAQSTGTNTPPTHEWKEAQLKRLIAWLESILRQLHHSGSGEANETQQQQQWQRESAVHVLVCLGALVKCQPRAATCAWELFAADRSDILATLKKPCIDGEEFIVAVLQCLDVISTALHASTLAGDGLSSSALTVCNDAGSAVMQLHYVIRPTFRDATACANNSGMSATSTSYLIHSLSLLGRLCLLSAEFTRAHVSELFGLARTLLPCGLEVTRAAATWPPTPQRVYPAQQALYFEPDGDAESDATRAQRNNGGKVSKARKLRVARNKPIDVQSEENAAGVGGVVVAFTALTDVRTSDSDASDPEGSNSGSNRAAYERHRSAKVRLLAINLLGVISTGIERRTIYAYLHVLFSSTVDSAESTTAAATTLLNVALRDPGVRCRSAALQVAAQIIYNVRQLLYQAESVGSGGRTSTSAFLTFSQNVAAMVVAMYDKLTTILATESSLPVLTQALKCLAALVQATPFQKLETGFITRCIPHVRVLVGHRDYVVQVSALMVMQFLVATTQPTPEIADVAGLGKRTAPSAASEYSLLHEKTVMAGIVPPIALQPQSTEYPRSAIPTAMVDSSEDVMLDEFIESDVEIQGAITGGLEAAVVAPLVAEPPATVTAAPVKDNPPESHSTTLSWLLERVLQNLECSASPQRCFQRTLPATVRIESLQMLSALASAGYADQLLSHLQPLAGILRTALLDPSLDVRLYAARLVDTCAYEFNRFLAAGGDLDLVLLENCQRFWQQLLPVLMDHIASPLEHAATLKICLCDALSHLGQRTYEGLPRPLQLQLLSFLSGVSTSTSSGAEPGGGSGGTDNGEVLVRAAAVRAMAMFVLFPSLSHDLVFVENTAESILRLLADSNLQVRVKAVWALGNVSDALLENCTRRGGGGDGGERISSELLQRLIQAALTASGDNDKVRCNAVRTLGNLLRLLDSIADESHYEMFQRAAGKLCECVRATSGSAKVKWNAAYAIGNLLRNAAFFDPAVLAAGGTTDWRASLFGALCHVIVLHANFKVRINAAAAIVSLDRRRHFGTHFPLFWSTLMAALEQSSRLEHFSEYNHRDQLQEQLCFTICHLLAHAQADDLPLMRPPLVTHFDMVQQIWRRVVNRLVPERAAPLCSCASTLRKRLSAESPSIVLSLEQLNALGLIDEAFNCL